MGIEKNGLLYSDFENISLFRRKTNNPVKHANVKNIIILHYFRCNIFTVTNINKKCNCHNDDKKK